MIATCVFVSLWDKQEQNDRGQHAKKDTQRQTHKDRHTKTHEDKHAQIRSHPPAAFLVALLQILKACLVQQIWLKSHCADQFPLPIKKSSFDWIRIPAYSLENTPSGLKKKRQRQVFRFFFHFLQWFTNCYKLINEKKIYLCWVLPKYLWKIFKTDALGNRCGS